MANWSKDTYAEGAKPEMGPYLRFLLGKIEVLEVEFTCSAIAEKLMPPTSYLQSEIDQTRKSVLDSLRLSDQSDSCSASHSLGVSTVPHSVSQSPRPTS